MGRGGNGRMGGKKGGREMITVPLRDGYEMYLDDEDAWIGGLRVCLVNNKKCRVIYAIARIKGVSHLVHRLILEAPKGVRVDHRDHNGLNNVRSNLRFATNSENISNARKQNKRETTSKFKGCAWRKALGAWVVSINKNYRNIYGGSYTSEEEAARVYDALACKYHGAFACLNFPGEPLVPVDQLEKRQSNFTGYRGVTQEVRGVTTRWRATIRIKGRKIFLGKFSTAEDAARAYDKVAQRTKSNPSRYLNFSQD